MTPDPIDLIELHARRLLTEWERARSDTRWLLTRDHDLAAVDTDTDEHRVAPNHVELVDKMRLGVLA